MSSQNNLVAFLVGALAGGITAVLLAPDKGSVTRERIREGARQVADRGTEMAKDTAETVTDTARRQAGAVKSAVEEGSEAYHREVEKKAKS